MSELQFNTALCPRCGKVKSIDDFYKIQTRPKGISHKCKQCISELNKTPNYKKTRSAYIQKNVSKYKQWQKQWDARHPIQRKEIDRRSRLRRKQKVIKHYGGQCSCCGEKILDFLAIDHINGGGTQERNKLKMGGNGIYLYIIRENFPQGFRVLCHNCNWGVHVNHGVCPHKLNTLLN